MPVTNSPSAITIPAIILAGGMGTRLRSVIADKPKVLAPIRGRPFLSYLLDQLEEAGWREIILCTGYMGEQIHQEYGATYRGLSLSYSVENEPLGTGGALRLALSQTTNNLCLAMNGDSYVGADLQAFLNWHKTHEFTGSLLLTQVADTSRYGTVEIDDHDAISAFREKQGLSRPGWINSGVYLLSRALLESIPANQVTSMERDCFPQWIASGLGGFRTESAFIDIGTPESFASTEAFFSTMKSKTRS